MDGCEAPGIRRLILTASGGPFLDWTEARLRQATPEQACAHPNWVMGRKISVDSATLMNKGLELIEACALVRPAAGAAWRSWCIRRASSIRWSSTSTARCSRSSAPPDMRTPIAQALAWPQRMEAGVQSLDFVQLGRLDFRRPDPRRFPCLRLAPAAIRAGGAMPAILNAANEVAVQAFLDRRLNFLDIPAVIETVMDSISGVAATDLPAVLAADAAARVRAEAAVAVARRLRGVGRLTLSWQHLLAFIVAVSLLVTIHEFGHYCVARLLGFKVLRFSVGFGRALLRKVAGRDRTEYVLAAIPLGGYVKMLDEREGPVAPEEVHRAFTRRPHWQRILVLLAGPAFNIAFAVLVMAALFMINGITDLRPLVGKVRRDSPASRAGLTGGRGDPRRRRSCHARAARGDDRAARRGQRRRGRRRCASPRSRAASARLRLSIPDADERRRLTQPVRADDRPGLRLLDAAARQRCSARSSRRARRPARA